MADGSIKINTKLDNTEAQKDLNDLEKMCERTAKNVEKTNAKVSISSETDDGVSQKTKSKWLSVDSESSLKKAQKRLQAIREEISKIETDTNKDLALTVTDDQAAKLLELEALQTKELNAEYGHLIKQVDSYKKAKEATSGNVHQGAFKDASAELSTDASATAFLSRIKTLEQYNAALSTTKARMTEIEASAQRLATKKGVDATELLRANKEYQKLDSRLKMLTKHQGEFKSATKLSFGDASNYADKFGHSIKKGMRRIARLSLAMFGIEGVFTAVRQVANSYINTNEELANSIQGVKGAFGELLGPIIERVINLIKVAMSYVFAFVKALTGVDYVARYNAKALKKQTSATKELAKAQRQSAGFDEQNKLSEPSSSSGGGGVSGGVSGGTLDLPTLSDETLKKIQEFADKFKIAKEWISENKKELLIIAGVILGIVGAFKLLRGAASVLNIFKALSPIFTILGEKIGGVLKHIGTFISAHKALVLGIMEVAAGLVMVIAGVKDFIKNGPTMENTIMIIGGAIAIAIGLATSGLSLLVSAIIGVVTAVSAFIVAIALEEEAIMSTEEAQENLTNAKERAKEAENGYINAVDAAEASLKKLEEAEKKAGITGEELAKQVQSGVLDYANMTDAQKEVYKAYLDNEQKQKDLKASTEQFNAAKKEETLASYENQLALAKESDNYDEFKKSVVDAFESGELSADEARELLEKSMSEMSGATQDAFMEDIPSAIKDGLNPNEYKTTRQKLVESFGTLKDKIAEKFKDIGTKVGNALESSIKTIINNLFTSIERRVNQFIRMINSAIGIINKIPNVNIGTIQEVKLPRLAKGGIVNNIGRGVPLIAGEAGPEAILPLDGPNIGWMDTLAEKINGGNATIPIYLDGKLIAKYVIDLQKRQTFATNGGF